MDPLANITLASGYMNICRCCLQTEGGEEILTDYSVSGGEMFGELLNYTFGIQLYSHETQEKCLICENCVSRLKDAKAFKDMVLQSDQIFKDYVNNLGSVDIKLQSVKEEPISENHEETTVFDKQDDDSCDDDEKDWSKIIERRGNGPLLRENSLKLIQNSTVCVFQWNKGRYICFCCKDPFTDWNLLKEHTYNAHTIKNIEKIIILQQNRLVKVEISNLECRLCREKVESLSTLRSHLSDTHGRAIGDNLLVPFRIEKQLKCQICLENFTGFRLLNIHMNKHFQKQVCHICGAGFSNLVSLNLHKSRSHKILSCKTCDITFNKKSDKKKHEIAVHGAKFERKLRFPCPHCPARFYQENFKVMHLVESHGMEKPQYPCEMCPKVFITKSLVNNHVKNVHKKEKKHECDICHIFFYSKYDVARHRVSHTGEKKYSCSICNSFFASKDSLRRHVKRTHPHVNKSAFE